MHRIALAGSMILMASIAWHCTSIQPGVVKEQRADGSIHMTVTGMASKRAIEKDSVAMKKTTSRSAAELTVKAELKNMLKLDDKVRNYSALIKKHFKEIERYTLEKGKYYRIIGLFYPDGIPESEATK